MTKDTDLAYTAGYIDGDGCFSIRKIKSKKSFKYSNSVCISSTNLPIMTWFEKTFEGHIKIQANVPNNQKKQYHFYFTGQEKIQVCTSLIPFLVEKKEECKLLLQFQYDSSKEIKDALLERMYKLKNYENLVTRCFKKDIEVFSNTISPEEKDFAYLAGFIDAECSLGIQKYLPKNKPNFVYKIILQCNNTKLPVFKWLVERFGGRVHFIDRSHFVPACRNQMTWRLSSKALFPILKEVIFFLKNKKHIAQELINFYETTLKNGGARHTEEFRSSYGKTLVYREQLFHKIQSLNKKGINI